MSLPSRSFAVAIFRFVLVSLLAFVVLIGTTLLIAFGTAWYEDGAWNHPNHLSIGLVCAVITWRFVAIFHLRRETHSMPFSQREQFLLKAKTVLHEMGYVLTVQHANAL